MAKYKKTVDNTIKKQIIVKEEDWNESVYRTLEWEQMHPIKKWEHDFMKKQYVIDYIEIYDDDIEE